MANIYTAVDWTSTTVTATGNTTLVSAGGSGTSIEILTLTYANNTTTTGQVDIGFRDGAAGTIHMRHLTETIGDGFEFSFSTPWTLGTNSAFIVNMSAGTAPSLLVSVHYRLLDRDFPV